MRHVKEKTYHGHTFFLHNPLELDDDDFDLLKLDHIYLLCFPRRALTNYSPVLHYGRSSLKHIFTCPLTRMDDKLQENDIRYDHLELGLLNLDDDHHLTSSSMGYIKSSFWYIPIEAYLNHIRIHHTHIEHRLVHEAILTRLPYQEMTWYHLIHHLALCLIDLSPLFALWLDQPCIFSYLFIMVTSWR